MGPNSKLFAALSLASFTLLLFSASQCGGGSQRARPDAGPDAGGPPVDAGPNMPDAGLPPVFEDSCPDVEGLQVDDSDGDGLGDACDPDRDGDGLPNDQDAWPDDRCCVADLDGDGICDARDLDQDGDGFEGGLERRLGFSDTNAGAHPAVAAEGFTPCSDPLPDADLDGDGTRNADDEDDDGDGLADSVECDEGSDPYDPASLPGLPRQPPARCDFGPLPNGGWLKGDLHLHTNYSGDAQSMGGDDVGPSLRIAEWYGHPQMLRRHPEFQGRGFDFLSVTDHRTADAIFDPAFRSNRLLVIQGIEFAGGAHSGTQHISSFIQHEPERGRSEQEQRQHAIDLTRAQGGLVVVNHPMNGGNAWTWDLQRYEAMEVWNGFWGVREDVMTEEQLAQHLERHGSVSPHAQLARKWSGEEFQGAHLAFWEAHLVGGVHTAPVGGGDRHILVVPGSPTTWVKAERFTVEAVIDAIRRRRTFVGRSPAGVMMEMRLRAGERIIEMGDAVPHAEVSGGTVEVDVKGAAGGRVELVAAPILEAPADPAQRDAWLRTPRPPVVATLDVASDDETVRFEWQSDGPAFIYARVLEPLKLDAFPGGRRAEAEALITAMGMRSIGIAGLLDLLANFLSIDGFLNPEKCRPESSQPGDFECVPVDDIPGGTFMQSQALDLAMNAVLENGQSNGFAMGAIGSAILLR